MPVELSTFELPCGARCVRMVTSGHFSTEDARSVIQRTSPGGDLFGLQRLILTQQQQSISAEARSLFGARPDQSEGGAWIAVVVISPVIRVTTNFILRINRNKNVRLFTSEAEATQWLDQRARELAARSS